MMTWQCCAMPGGAHGSAPCALWRSGGAFVVLTAFYLIPIIAIQGLINIDQLRKIHAIAVIIDLPFVSSVITAILPGINLFRSLYLEALEILPCSALATVVSLLTSPLSALSRIPILPDTIHSEGLYKERLPLSKLRPVTVVSASLFRMLLLMTEQRPRGKTFFAA